MTESTRKPTVLEDGDELESFVAAHEVALVELYTKGCSTCQAMEPVLGNVARETGVPIGLLNPGDDLALVDRFDVTSVPQLVLFEEGKRVGSIADGFLGAEAVVDFLETHVPSALDGEA